MTIFEHNQAILRQRFPHLQHINSHGTCTLGPSYNGEATLYVARDGGPAYVHSPVYPLGEAYAWIEAFPDIDPEAHVIFFGIGLGYHIQAFQRKHPGAGFSIFEPSEDIMHAFLNQTALDEIFSLANLADIIVGGNGYNGASLLNRLIDRVSKVLVIAWPGYAAIFREEFQAFTQTLQQLVAYKQDKIAINLHYEKQWTLNSLHNFPYVISTVNFLNAGRSFLKNKPVALVAAGPSLTEEIEHLRRIKEQGLAYIFSVGSAVNALIEAGIHPDATFTYDPQLHNVNVIQKIIDKGITSIPLIFGSTVGRGTLDRYPGPKAHLIISQDTIAQRLLQAKAGDRPAIVNDAPSVSIIALQCLIQLEAGPVILIGQNFAYRGNDYYASGVPYSESTPLSDGLPLVDGVNGDQIVSNLSLIRMKREMEFYIRQNPRLEVINTTQGGAHIEGTTFCSLREAIEHRLTQKGVVEKWLQQEERPDYDWDYLREQGQRLDLERKHYDALLTDIEQKLMELAHRVRKKQPLHSDLFVQFDALFEAMLHNEYFKVYLQPRNRVVFELLYGKVDSIQRDHNALSKAEKILRYFGDFIMECRRDYEELNSIISSFHLSLMR